MPCYTTYNKDHEPYISKDNNAEDKSMLKSYQQKDKKYKKQRANQ